MTDQSYDWMVIYMPTTTFFNLPDSKRQKFIETALAEFANNDYESASISKIVLAAGIAKGSLYQYFHDKQDLYFYLVGLAAQKKRDFLEDLLVSDPSVSVFDHLHELFAAMLGFQREYPLMAKLGNRILDATSPFPNEFLEQARAATQKQFSDLFTKGQLTNEIRADVNPETAGFILSAVILEVGNREDMTLTDFEKVYSQMVTILKDGMAQPIKNMENNNGNI